MSPTELNADERLRDAAPQLRDALETLLFVFEESHGDEVENEHYGDDPPCSYCEAIDKAKAALTVAGGDESDE